jgi:hypothetical protein
LISNVKKSGFENHAQTHTSRPESPPIIALTAGILLKKKDMFRILVE